MGTASPVYGLPSQRLDARVIACSRHGPRRRRAQLHTHLDWCAGGDVEQVAQRVDHLQTVVCRPGVAELPCLLLDQGAAEFTVVLRQRHGLGRRGQCAHRLVEVANFALQVIHVLSPNSGSSSEGGGDAASEAISDSAQRINGAARAILDALEPMAELPTEEVA